MSATMLDFRSIIKSKTQIDDKISISDKSKINLKRIT